MPPAPGKAAHDGVFVGAGHNAMVCAAYLARCGLRVLLLEAAPTIGGGTTTAEVTLPGFRHNLHAFFVRWTPDYTIWKDLGLGGYSVDSIWPEVQNGIPVDGGAAALVTYRDVARSLTEIARFSRRDAETYASVYDEFASITRLVDTPLRMSPPLPGDHLGKLLEGSDLGRRYLALKAQAPLDLVRNLFESEPVRALVLFNISVRGYLANLDRPGLGAIASLALPNSHDGRIIAKGTMEVSNAMADAIRARGGTILTDARVAAIDVRDGRARGVTLQDGRTFTADRFVVSGAPAPITLLELVGADRLDPGLRDDLAGYRWLEEALFGVHWALDDRPRFTAEAFAPDLPHALNLAIGYESSDDFVRHMEAVRAERLTPDAPIHASIPTVHDPSQAPPRRHTAFGWHFVPGPSTRGKWDTAAVDERTAAIVALYERYAPNMSSATLAIEAHSPDATEARVISMRGGDRHHGSYHPSNWGYNRPSPLMPGYRTPIDGLYLCGASQHPGGSFTGQPGYNAAGVIASDLGIEPWWPRFDAEDALTALG